MKQSRLGSALALLGATLAHGAEHEWRGAVATQVNPLGLRVNLGYQLNWPLSASTSALLKDAHVSVGVLDSLSPAYNRLETWIEVSPLSILDLRAGADLAAYFGTFGHLVAFSGYDADFSDDARRTIREQAVSGSQRRLYATPTLKLKLGRLLLRSTADFEGWKLLSGPGPFTYEPFRGTLLRSAGDSLLSLSDLLLVEVHASRPGALRIGIYHDLLRVWDAPQNDVQRVGPLVSLKLGARHLGAREPVLYVGVPVYLQTPNRGGVGAFVAITFRVGRGAWP